MTQTSMTGMQGAIHGGRQPVAGAAVYVYQASTTAYGGASTSLLTSFPTGTFPTTQDANGNYYVTSNAQGNFTLTGEYTCTAGTQVYLYAVGGNPGLTPTAGNPSATNPASGLMALVGQCPVGGAFAATVPYIVVNEVSTIAAAYSAAGFAIDPTHIGSSGTALAKVGIANAFANATNISSIGVAGIGGAPAMTPSGNGTVPQAEINALGNSLAACVNSTGASSSQCATLFSTATQNGASSGTQPTTTAGAAINIAHFPGTNVTTIFNLAAGIGTPYQPTLSSPPSDFTIALTFAGGGLNYPDDVAVDPAGNVWASNKLGDSISELSSLGTAMSPSTGFTGGGLNQPAAIAIDPLGNVWVGNAGSQVVSKFSGLTGVPLSTLGYTTPVYTTALLAIDGAGSVWVGSPSTGNTAQQQYPAIAQLSNAGAITYVDNALGLNTAIESITIDNQAQGQNIWVTDFTGGTVTLFELSNSGSTVSNKGAVGSATSGGAEDNFGNLWTTNQSQSFLLETNNAGVVVRTIAGSAYSLNAPFAVTIDGSNNIWVANTSQGVPPGSISEFTNAGAVLSSSTKANIGYGSDTLRNPQSIAIDGSGNVWVGNYSILSTIVELVGGATPVVTPLSVGSRDSSLGKRP